MAVELSRKTFTPYAAKKGEEYMNAKQRSHFRKILETLKSELSQEIEARILALKPGEISEPYRSDLGFHVFRLESKEGLEGEGLSRARQQIRDILFRQKYEARLDAWVREIRERAVIEVRM